MIYKLSETARQMTYAQWLKNGGYRFEQLDSWDHNKVTLGDIEDAFPVTGQCCARYAVEHLQLQSMAQLAMKDEEWQARAADEYTDDAIRFDANAKVSIAEDGTGAWVQAWVWVDA